MSTPVSTGQLAGEGGPLQPPSDIPPPQSVHRAFVVQFWANTDIARGRYVGRVEHIVSGDTTRFTSLEALLAFIEQILARVQGQHLDEF